MEELRQRAGSRAEDVAVRLNIAHPQQGNQKQDDTKTASRPVSSYLAQALPVQH